MTGTRKGTAAIATTIPRTPTDQLASLAATIASGMVSRGDDLQTTQGYGAIAQAAVTIAQEIQREAERRG